MVATRSVPTVPTAVDVRLADVVPPPAHVVDPMSPPDISTPEGGYPGARRPDRSRWVTASGLRIATYEWGDADAPVIFAAHGGFDFAATFDLLAPRLADAGWRVVSWDARGHGSSEHAALYSWTADERDAVAVLDSVTEEPVVFLGHSKGGGMMLDMAHAIPHRLSHLVNLDGLPTRNSWPDLAERERTHLMHTELEAWLDHRRRTATLERPPGTVADLAARRQRMNPRLGLDWLEYLVPIGATHSPDGWRWNIDPTLRFGSPGPWRPEWAMEHLCGIGVPVLGVLGLETELMGWGTRPEDVLDNLPPLGRYEGLDGIGHFVHIEAPDRVAELVVDFLGDPPSRGGGRAAMPPVRPGWQGAAASTDVDVAPATVEDDPLAPVQFLTHGRTRLALHHLAPGSDPDVRPLLVLHGLGEHIDGVPPQASTWRGPVYGLDFTGHGRSSLPTGGGYTAEVLVADVDAALAAIGPATLLGRGLGAWVAMLAAGARPSLVRGAVLIDGPGLIGGGSRPHSPSLPYLGGPHRTPDPYALHELARDVRNPEYATDYVRLAVAWSGLDRPVAVCTTVRGGWVPTVAGLSGVLDTDVASALEEYANAPDA